MAEVDPCSTPRLKRIVQSDVSWVSSAAGVTVVVASGGNYDQVAFLEGNRLRPLPGPRARAAYTPSVSPKGDVAYVAYDGQRMSLMVLRRGSNMPIRLYRAPNRVLHNPTWNTSGELAVIETDLSGTERPRPATLLMFPPGAAPRHRSIDLPTAIQSFLIDRRRMVVASEPGDQGHPQAVVLDMDTGRFTPLPVGLRPLAPVPGADAFLVRDAAGGLVLLTGTGYGDQQPIGVVEGRLVEAAAFIRP